MEDVWTPPAQPTTLSSTSTSCTCPLQRNQEDHSDQETVFLTNISISSAKPWHLLPFHGLFTLLQLARRYRNIHTTTTSLHHQHCCPVPDLWSNLCVIGGDLLPRCIWYYSVAVYSEIKLLQQCVELSLFQKKQKVFKNKLYGFLRGMCYSTYTHTGKCGGGASQHH